MSKDLLTMILPANITIKTNSFASKYHYRDKLLPANITIETNCFASKYHCRDSFTSNITIERVLTANTVKPINVLD